MFPGAICTVFCRMTTAIPDKLHKIKMKGRKEDTLARCHAIFENFAKEMKKLRLQEKLRWHGRHPQDQVWPSHWDLGFF